MPHEITLSDEQMAELRRVRDEGYSERDLREIDAMAPPVSLNDVMQNVFERMENPEPWVPTGLRRVDKYLDGGVRPGEFMILAARPGVGKSALALQMILSMLSDDRPVMLWSLEMRPEQWVRRALAALSTVKLGNIRRGELKGDDFVNLNTAATALHHKPLHFAPHTVDTAPEGFRGVAKTAVNVFGCQVLFIDYLQLMDPDPTAPSREQEVARASREIKKVSIDLKVPIVALCQLHRDAQNKVPTLANLRESGSLEQDADIVMFLHRDANPETNLLTNDALLVVGKNRDGETGGVRAKYRWESFSFEELV